MFVLIFFNQSVMDCGFGFWTQSLDLEQPSLDNISVDFNCLR